MDWTKLFFSADGRIARQPYWIGWLVLLGVNSLLFWVPFLSFVTIYCWICISAKRFHDMGKSGWLAAIPVAIGLVVPLVAIVAIASTAIVAATANGSDETVAAAVISALLGSVLFFAIGGLVSLGFLIWEGVAEGEPGDNRYGPPPPRDAFATPPAPTPATPPASILTSTDVVTPG